MASLVNDSKPRLILGEYKVTQNLPTEPSVLDARWTLATFRSKFRVVIIRRDNTDMEFDLIGIHPFLANTLRRLILSDVPSMAIEKVHVYNNTSIIQDEVLAHRLGLIPLKADPRLFDLKPDPSADPADADTLEFTLKVRCSNNKDSTNSLRAEDMYKNNNVYSKHIKWQPIGAQRDQLKEEDVGPIEGDILIAKMRPGHELDLRLIAVKGTGRDHAKFQPVATAFYRLLPEIVLTRDVEGEAADRLEKCFSPGVIGVRHAKGKRFAFVNDSRYDTSSRNVFRHDDLKDAVAITKVQDHFIFTIESVGALKPDAIFIEALKILKDKCLSLLDELNNS